MVEKLNEKEKIKEIKRKRKKEKERKPYFFPQGFGRKKRIKERWRRPRGIDSKKRIEKKYTGAVPKIGYKKENEIRYYHPSGMREILIRSKKEFEEKINEIKEKNLAVRLSSTLGKKKREEIVSIANLEKIKILNP